MARAPLVFPVAAGELDNYIELRHRVLTAGTAGEQIASWPAAYATTWAAKRDARGNKRFLASQVISVQLTEFTLRWRDDVLATDRLYTEGETYEILQIAEIGRHVGLDLLCQRVAPEAAA